MGGKELLNCGITLAVLALLLVNKVNGSPGEGEGSLLSDDLEWDAVVADIADRYTEFNQDTFWHPYIFGTGNQNRETITVDDAKKKFIPGDYLEWKYARVGLKYYLVARALNAIDIFDSDFKNVSSITSERSYTALAVHTQWNEEHYQAELIMIAATDANELIISRLKDNYVETLGSYPLMYPVREMQFCHVGISTKVVVISEDSDVYIYNVEIMNSTQLWFYQRLPQAPNRNSPVVVYDSFSEVMDSVIAVGHTSELLIFTFNSKAGLFEVYRTIKMPECRRLFSFSISYQHHIGCIPSDDQANLTFISYNYNNNEYEYALKGEVFGGIKPDDVFPLAVADYRDEYLLLVRDLSDNLHVLSYKGPHEGFVSTQICSTGVNGDCPSSNLDFSRAVGFPYQKQTSCIFPGGESIKGSWLFSIETTVSDNVSPLVHQSRNLHQTFQDYSTRFEKWERGVIGVTSRLQYKLLLDKQNRITGEWKIAHINSGSLLVSNATSASSSASSQNLGLIESFQFGRVTWTSEDYLADTSMVEEALLLFRTGLNSAQLQLSDALVKNDSRNQSVVAEQLFLAMLSPDNIYAETLTVKSIQDRKDPGEVFDSLLHQSNLLKFNGTVEFATMPEFTSLTTTTLNRYEVKDFAVLTQPNRFTCLVEFGNKFNVQGNLESPSINGMELSTEVILPSHMEGLYFMDGFIVENNTETSEDLYDFKKVLLQSQPKTILSAIHFHSVVVEYLADVELLDGYNCSSFLSSVVTQNYSSVVAGLKNVEGEVSVESLTIKESWNSLPFPTSFVHTGQPIIRLKKGKSFSNVTANKVTISGQLDGHDLKNYVELNAQMKIRQIWNFYGPVVFVKGIGVSGTVDGVNMKELLYFGTLNESRVPSLVNADVYFENEMQMDKLSILFDINEKDFSQTFGNLQLFNGSKCYLSSPTIIETNLVVDNINVMSEKVNSNDLNIFMTISGDQNVSAKIHLENNCRFESLYALKEYDSIVVSNLLDTALRLTGNNTINWKAHFQRITCGKSFVAGKKVNGLDDYGHSVARTAGTDTQDFSSIVNFKNVIFTDLDVEDNLVTRPGSTIALVDIGNWISNRLSLSKNQTIEHAFRIEGRAKTSYDVLTSSLNGFPIVPLYKDTFQLGKDSQVFAKTVVLPGISVWDGRISFQSEINGHNLQDLVENGFPLNSKRHEVLELKGSWYFESIIASEHLTINGNVCGVDLDALNNDCMRNGDKNGTIYGNVNISRLQVEKSIVADTINGKVSSDMFTLNGSQTVSCNFTFLKDVTVVGRLELVGDINDHPILSLTEIYSHQKDTLYIHGDLETAEMVSTDSLIVQGTTQNDMLEDWIQNLAKIDDDIELEFNADTYFMNPIIIDDNCEVEKYNGMDPRATLGFKRLDRNQQFQSRVIFKGPVNAKGVDMQEGDFNADSIVNLDWTDLLKKFIRLVDLSPEDLNLYNLNVFQHLIVQHSVTVDNFQGNNFDEYLTIQTTQTLQKLKVGTTKLTNSDISIAGLIAGIDLQKEYHDTLMIRNNEPHHVTGRKIFQGYVTVKGNFSCFGQELKKSIIDISKDVTFTHPVTFVDPIYINGDMVVSEKSAEPYSYDHVLSAALTKDDDQTFAGAWTFNNVTFEQDVEGNGTLENYDIEGLTRSKNNEIQDVSERIAKQKELYQKTCYEIFNATTGLISNPRKLDAFDKHQTIILRKQVKQAVTVSVAEKLYLLTVSGPCEITKYQWKMNPELFYQEIETEESRLKLGHVKDWKAVTLGDTGLLVFSTENSSCSPLEEGLYFVTLNPSGEFGQVTPIATAPIASFGVAVDSENDRTAIFAITNDATLKIFPWSEQTQAFRPDNEETLDENCLEVVLTNYADGVGVMLRFDHKISFIHYSWVSTEIYTISKDVFVRPAQYLARVAGDEKDMYAIVPGNQTQNWSVYPFCSIQVMKISNGHSTRIQEFRIPDLVAVEVFTFSRQTYFGFLSKTFGLQLYKLMGISGLQLLNPNPSKIFNGLQLGSFEVKPWSLSSSRPFLFVLRNYSIEIFHSNVYGDSLNIDTQNLCRV